jgi:hypothetical protein
MTVSFPSYRRLAAAPPALRLSVTASPDLGEEHVHKVNEYGPRFMPAQKMGLYAQAAEGSPQIKHRERNQDQFRRFTYEQPAKPPEEFHAFQNVSFHLQVPHFHKEFGGLVVFRCSLQRLPEKQFEIGNATRFLKNNHPYHRCKFCLELLAPLLLSNCSWAMAAFRAASRFRKAASLSALPFGSIIARPRFL